MGQAQADGLLFVIPKTEGILAAHAAIAVILVVEKSLVGIGASPFTFRIGIENGMSFYEEQLCFRFDIFFFHCWLYYLGMKE